jgi:hypothetical protein
MASMLKPGLPEDSGSRFSYDLIDIKGEGRGYAP